MKNKRRIRIASILFAIAAVFAVFFVLSYDKPEKVATTYDNTNSEKTIERKIVNDASAEDVSEKTDWQDLIEKWKGKDISRIKTDRKVIALTFDGGANADGVEDILGILEKENIKGTFFLTGKFIEKYPFETKMIILSGGNIGNHSYSHPYFTKIADEEIKSELTKTENELSELNATFQPFFRFPYGDRNAKAILAVNENGYISIRWAIDSLGWKGTFGGMTKEAVENRIISKTVPGTIIMMHLGTNPDDKTQLDSEALPEIIQKLKSNGYSFATLSEILAEQID